MPTMIRSGVSTALGAEFCIYPLIATGTYAIKILNNQSEPYAKRKYGGIFQIFPDYPVVGDFMQISYQAIWLKTTLFNYRADFGNQSSVGFFWNYEGIEWEFWQGS